MHETKMVRLKGDGLNQLFSVVADWGRNLKGFALDEDRLLPEDLSPDI